MIDPHSYARPHEARVAHISLDLSVDFSNRRLHGRATLSLVVGNDAREVRLDSRGLTIHGVYGAMGEPLPFALNEPDPILGQCLSVTLSNGVTQIRVDYETGHQAAALLWLERHQTSGGQHPFLFSAGHGILARTWLPTQDTPSVRQTYDARITVPAALTAVMSAEHLTPNGVSAADDMRRFDFHMPQPIPPHLIALAVGELSFRELGPRTGVYAEPGLVESAAYEFADLELMMSTGESIAGPYRWDRLDLLVLPPSFPYGGMENPRLTFLTPTLIVGDRSLTTLVAHELAHAWAGNLVVNATWNDFWLNEGFTVYMELRIMEALYSPERADMLEVYGYRELALEVERLGPMSPDTALHMQLDGRDPEEGLTVIPYVKGAAFLRAIERVVGRERFDIYLRSWFDRHAFASVTTAEFVTDLQEHLLDPITESSSALDIQSWVYEPGVPDDARPPISMALMHVEELAQSFLSGHPLDVERTAAWTPQEWRHFLNVLPVVLSAASLDDLHERANLSTSLNAEILFAWLRLAVRTQYELAVPALRHFLTSQGRGKFVRPLYRELMLTEWGRPLAREIYRTARPLYHATITRGLDALISN